MLSRFVELLSKVVCLRGRRKAAYPADDEKASAAHMGMRIRHEREYDDAAGDASRLWN